MMQRINLTGKAVRRNAPASLLSVLLMRSPCQMWPSNTKTSVCATAGASFAGGCAGPAADSGFLAPECPAAARSTATRIFCSVSLLRGLLGMARIWRISLVAAGLE